MPVGDFPAVTFLNGRGSVYDVRYLRTVFSAD